MGRSALILHSLAFMAVVACTGKAREITKGSSLGPPVIGDDGTRSDGTDFGQIYTVTTVVEATDDIPEWTDADLPFTSGRNAWNIETQNKQWPFKFTYTYPPNNYKLNQAHVVIVTQRDNSDTEAIFVDGVMTGRPPGGNVSATSPHVTNRHYLCVGACSGPAPTTPSNTYFMDWALTHYKVATKNSFDLNIADLLTPTTVKVTDVVSDGVVRVVTGDDSAIFDNYNSYWNKPILMMEGFTISKTALTCSNSSNYRFLNTYIHNDGNSIGQATFSGDVVSPVTSWTNAMSGFRTVEFYYDPRLPRVPVANLTLSKAELAVQVKRAATGSSAIIINGIGVAEAGFDDSTATSAVESWELSSTAVSYWTSFVTGIPNNNTSQTRTLNLVSLLGEAKVKELLAQGKLNVAISGGLATVSGAAASSTRTYGVQVAGPELVLEGEYYTQLCSVPNDPTSPLSDSSGTPGSCDLDETSPVASSVQVVNITNNSATVQWLTNEGADSQIGYGISGTGTNTTLDATLSNFHSVTITGLQPYKYYQYVVKTKDGCGNQTISSTRTFRTLR
ncbi:fibronectin type III domain-containing protein [Bdellovibrio sp. HCB337]|uniref:fibronectin type III domain-containing protein n=1 Tax=Bdellovibrio sp. HCB337 TaxID=3394358 RepID=UPI0039A56ED2